MGVLADRIKAAQPPPQESEPEAPPLGGGGIVSETPAAKASETQRELPMIGGSGTLNYDGYVISTEYLPELQGKQGLRVWEEMRRSDPSVRETLGHIDAPIKNADWVVVAPDDPDDLEQEVTEFVRCAFFEWLDESFSQVLDQVLSYNYLGASVFETTFKVEKRSLTLTKTMAAAEPGEELDDEADLPLAAADPPPPDDPLADVPKTPELPTQEQVRLPERQFVTWRTFAQRLLTTIEQWNQNEHEQLVSVTQLVAKTNPDGTQEYHQKTIESQYLLVFVNDRQGTEWTGVSALRSAYKPWVLKQLIERTMGISFERYGVGIPVAFLPADREGDVALMNRIEDMLTSLKAGDQNFLIFPGPEASGNRPGFTFRIESPGASSFPNYVDALEYLRGEIAGSLLTRFKELGQANTGSRATANTQAQVWYNLLHAIARYIEQAFSIAIRRLVDMNYTGVTRYPSLRASGIEDRNLLEFAQSVALLLNAEALVPDKPARDWVRRMVDAPPEDKDEAAARLEATQREGALEEYKSIRELEVQEPIETKRPRAENAKAADDERFEDVVASLARLEQLVVAAQAAGAAGHQQLSFQVIDGEVHESQLSAAAAAFDKVAEQLVELRADVNRPRAMRTTVIRDPDTNRVIGSEQVEA